MEIAANWGWLWCFTAGLRRKMPKAAFDGREHIRRFADRHGTSVQFFDTPLYLQPGDAYEDRSPCLGTGQWKRILRLK
jgi:hypothetical protein